MRANDYLGVTIDSETWDWLQARRPDLDADEITPGYWRVSGVKRSRGFGRNEQNEGNRNDRDTQARRVGKWTADRVKLDRAIRSIDRRIDKEVSAILQLRGYRRYRHAWRKNLKKPEVDENY